MHRTKQFLLLSAWLTLSTAAFCIPHFQWLVLLCLIPLFIFLEKFQGKRSILLFWVTGLIYCCLACSWMLNTNPVTWGNTSGWVVQSLIGIVWLLACLFLSSGFMILGLGYKYIASKLPAGLARLSTFAVLWVLCEYARSWLFSIFTAGPGASLGSYWNFGVLGLAGATTWLGPASRIVGLFGLSLLVVMANITLYMSLNRQWRTATLMLAGLVAISVLGWVWPLQHTRQVSVNVLQLGESDTNYQANLTQLLSSKSVQPAQLLVLTEYSRFFDGKQPTSDQNLAALARTDGTVLDDQDSNSANTLSNIIVVRDSAGNISYEQPKSFLVPTGEFLPYVVKWVALGLGFRDLVDYFEKYRTITGTRITPHPFASAGNTEIGSLACSGVIAPDLYQKLTRGGAQVLTNSAALGIFSNAPIYFEQSKHFSRFIAIANARPFIQSARAGASYVLDANGKLIASSPIDGLDVISARIQPQTTLTPYSRLGEWTIWPQLLGLACLAFYAYRRNGNEKSPAA